MSQNLAATHFNDDQWTAVDQAIAALEQRSCLLVAIGADDREMREMEEGSQAADSLEAG